MTHINNSANSEQHYLTILNSLNDAMHVVDRDLRIMYQNPAMINWLNKLKISSDVIGKTIFEAFPFLDYDKVYKEYDKIFQNGEVLITIDATKPFNRFLYTETSKIPIKNGEEVNQVITILKDITDQKEAEEKLKASEENYKNIINHLMDIIIILDLKGNFQYVSPQVYDISGFKPDEIIGRSGFKLMHPDDVKKAAIALKGAIKNKNTVYIEYRTIHKNGQYIDVAASGRIVNNEGEDKVFAVVRDISEQKKAEQKLKESEEKFRSITEQSFMSILVIQDGLIKYFNERISQINGYSNEEIQNWVPYEFMKVIHPEDKDFVLEQANKKQSGDPNVIPQYRYRLIRKDNKVRWVENYSKTINFQGKPADLVTSIDITDKIKAEQKLKESEEKYRLISENANDLIAVLNNKIEYEYVNEAAFQNLMGRSSNVLIGGNALRWVHPDDVEKCVSVFKEGWDEGEAIVEARFKDENDIYRWFEIKGKTIIDAKGEKKVLIVARDISERKEYEQRLKDSEEKYRYLIENALEGVWVIDTNANTILVNPAMAKILGYNVEEMIGKSVFSFIDEDQIEITKTQIERRKSGIADERVAEYLHKNGYKVYLRLRATPIFDKYGNYEGAYAFLEDITKRKKAEERIKESEEKYRLISENTDDMIVVFNEEGKIDYLNAETHEKILGYSGEKFKDKSFRDSIVHKDDIKLNNKSFNDIVNGRNFYSQFRLKHKNGEYLWFEVTGKTFLDNYGNKKLLCISRNINEKKQAEKKIKESEENFRTITEQAFIGTLIIQDDKVEYVNDALLQIFDFSSEEIHNWTKEDLSKLIFPEDLENLRKYREKLRAGEPDIKRFYSYRVFTKYGKLKWIDQFSKPIIYRGKPAELVTIMDITEKKKAEQELIKLNNLKSELLRRTSHELKTPLVSIKGFSELLLTVHKEKLDDYVLATVHEIKLGCERLENLIQDILKTSELESESVELKKREEDLSFLIKLCIKELQGLIRLRNHEISLDIHDKLTTWFEPDQIHLVLSNILSNAIKYTPPDGKIEITSALTQDYILISIKDNGVGITSEERKRLFSQFGKIERYGQGLDLITEGSGLGLYITKKIIELHGGTIRVKSAGRNKGSTFYFTLPLITKNE